jgi:hypothetical protein
MVPDTLDGGISGEIICLSPDLQRLLNKAIRAAPGVIGLHAVKAEAILHADIMGVAVEIRW